jgi:hypothetical protein
MRSSLLLLLSAALLCPGPLCAAATATATATGRAMRAQYAAQLGASLPTAIVVGSHNSFNTAPLPFEQQNATLTEQLDFGVRSLELDLHAIAALAPPRLRVCHGTRAFFDACSQVSFGEPCASLGVVDLGPIHTGCTAAAPAFEDLLREIAVWLRAPRNAGEVVVLRIEDHVEEADHAAINALLQTYLGEIAFTPAMLAAAGGVWPATTAKLVDADTRIVIMGENSQFGGTYAHVLTRTPAFPANAINNFDPATCSVRTGAAAGAPLAREFPYFFGDAIVVTHLGFTVYNGPQERGLVTADNAAALVACGFSPHFDFASPSLVSGGAIWSWRAGGEPSDTAATTTIVCTAMAASDGRWAASTSSTQCDTVKRQVACLTAGATGENSGDWALTRDPHAAPRVNATDPCTVAGQVAAGTRAAGTPSGPKANTALLAAIKLAGITTDVWLSLRTCSGSGSDERWGLMGHCAASRAENYAPLPEKASPSTSPADTSSSASLRAATGSLAFLLVSLLSALW